MAFISSVFNKIALFIIASSRTDQGLSNSCCLNASNNLRHSFLSTRAQTSSAVERDLNKPKEVESCNSGVQGYVDRIQGTRFARGHLSFRQSDFRSYVKRGPGITDPKLTPLFRREALIRRRGQYLDRARGGVARETSDLLQEIGLATPEGKRSQPPRDWRGFIAQRGLAIALIGYLRPAPETPRVGAQRLWTRRRNLGLETERRTCRQAALRIGRG